MSMKKLALLITTVTASIGFGNGALAGGPEYIPGYSGFYIEGSGGYAMRPWTRDVTTIPGRIHTAALMTGLSNANFGIIGAADIGYQCNQFIALEAGWFYLPKAAFTTRPAIAVNRIPMPASQFDIRGGIVYAALKGMALIYANTYMFGKIGSAYTYDTILSGVPNTNFTGTVTTTSFWNPIFAAGIQYYFTPNSSMSVQYAYVGGYRTGSQTRTFAPVSQMATVGIGYKFLM